MTIPLTGNGSLFSRLGAIFGAAADLLALEGGTATARVLSGASFQTRLQTLETAFAYSPQISSILAGDTGFGLATQALNPLMDNWINSNGALFQSLQQLAQNTLIKMADLDSGGLPQRTLQAALTYLVNQMTQGVSAPVQSATSVNNSSGVFGATGTYYYVVTATTDLGESAISNEQSASVAATTDEVTISWTQVTNATGYKVYRTRNSRTYTFPALVGTIGSGSTVSFTDTGAAATTGAAPVLGTAGTSIVGTTISLGGPTMIMGFANANPVFVISSVDGSGRTLQYASPETLTFTVVSDAQTGGATLGQERVQIQGQVAVSNPFSYQWPGGSGANVYLYATDAQVSDSGANPNVLQNGGFETFTTPSVPDNWTIAVGTAGTQVVSGGSGNAYKGSSSVGLVGDGSTLTTLTQVFNTTPTTSVGAGGTSYKPLPQTNYAVNGWLKLSAASPGTGKLWIMLTDGSGNVQSDASGNGCYTSVDLTAIADTNWHNFNATFRLPGALPPQVKISVGFTAPSGQTAHALASGTTVYIDAVAMNAMTSLYSGGPSVSIFSGNSPMISGDVWTGTITPTFGQVQLFMNRFFGLSALGLHVPASNNSPTVPDSVIA